MTGSKADAVGAALGADWESAYRLAVETMEEVSHRPFEVVALEIDGKVVWSRTPPAAAVAPDGQGELPPVRREQRKMVSAELMGAHSHRASNGVEVHVWRRNDRFVARGRLDGRPFGETLGEDPAQATARLRQLITEIERGSYVRASEARKRKVGRRSVPRLTLRELVGEFVAHKRQLLGRQTAANYFSRLRPVLDFAEARDNLRRWPFASDVNDEFASSLRAALFQHRSTRNGRPGGQPRMLSERQVVNILECLRTMLHWARSAEVRKLPADWVVPLTPAVVGVAPPTNPLRKDKLPLEARVALVHHLDRWQCCQLALSIVLPLRPDEAAGLIIGDVCFEDGWLEFGARFKDANFTKARTVFNVPFPDELVPVLRACVGGRTEGPLLRRREAFEGKCRGRQVISLKELDGLFQCELSRLAKGTVQSQQDRKSVFRRLLRRLGGISTDAMNVEFKRLLGAAGLKNGSTIYTLRSSVTTSMHAAGLSHLELRYLTGHSASDILNKYASLDPIRAMKRYFDAMRPLLDAIAARSARLGLL